MSCAEGSVLHRLLRAVKLLNLLGQLLIEKCIKFLLILAINQLNAQNLLL